MSSGHDVMMERKELVLLGKDFNHSDVYATEFIVNGTNLCFISGDGSMSLEAFTYDRDNPDSWNGRKLISK